jgi:hypothetical protein
LNATDREEATAVSVADLLEKVKVRVAKAPTIQAIRELADKALADARGHALTVAEIRQLSDVAVARARQVEECAARLAELLAEGDA